MEGMRRQQAEIHVEPQQSPLEMPGTYEGAGQVDPSEFPELSPVRRVPGVARSAAYPPVQRARQVPGIARRGLRFTR